jgi:hypothetical protein
LATLAEKSSGGFALIADGLFDYGEKGSSVPNSIYFRDFCYICDEPIRVPLDMIGLPNACSGCRPSMRGAPGVAEAERLFWIHETWDGAEVISG